ncbi:MAG TPA: hypothetical protein VF836_04605, partial [Gemmatimonadaceae bacterium]
SAAEPYRSSPRTWQPVRPEDAAKLTDCRLQLHHAAQFGAAAGISFLEHRPDESHTNLEWVPSLAGLFSRVIPTGRPFRIGARPSKFALLIVTEDNQPIAEYKLHGRTITDATEWIRSQIKDLGADPSRYTLRRDYEIAAHQVAIGESFDASAPTLFEELSKWFSNAATLLGSVVRKTRGASEVRCWPQHFDLATLIKVAPGRTIGMGLEPGDDFYDEPYFYLNMSPQPAASRAQSRPLWGNGTWHTNEWVGPVLPGSQFGAASAQERQVREFLDSATAACRALVTQS